MRLCEVEGCERKHYVKGMCNAHYQKNRKSKIVKNCKAEGCVKKASYVKSSLCEGHHSMFLRYGRTHNVNSKDGSGYFRKGYHTVNNKAVHRTIAEKALGKPLDSKHPVHHVDGDKTNNANSNLVICEDNAYHSLLHKRQRDLERSQG